MQAIAGKSGGMEGDSAAQAARDHGVIVTNMVATIIGTIVVGLLVWALTQLLAPLAGFVPGPVRMFGLLALVLGSFGWLWLFVCLDGARGNGIHAGRYRAFRHAVRHDQPTSLYARVVRATIIALDRFMGDAGARRNSLLPRGFGPFRLKRPAPLWTVRGLDRCMLLAVIYPLLCIQAVWIWSNHVGVLERALRMREMPGHWRALVAMMIVASAACLWRFVAASGWRQMPWWLVAMALTVAVSRFGGGESALAIGIAIGAYTSGFGAGYFMVAALAAFAFWMTSPGIVTFIAISAAVFASSEVVDHAAERRHGWLLLPAFSALLLAACILTPNLVPIDNNSFPWLTLLYFVGLLTLVNAPFDWLALGCTRLFLRAGLQRGGAWPFALAALDLLVSLVLLALLALAMLWATELFNQPIASAGHRPPVPLSGLLDMLADPRLRRDPSVWWLYATLFSTQIPALLNILLASFCLMRGVPAINRWLAARLPEAGGIELWSRLGVATVWSAQLAIAVFLGLCLSWYVYVAGFVWLLDGAFGTTLVDILRAARLQAG